MHKVRDSRAADLNWVNDCYQSIGFVPSAATDLIAIAEFDGQRAGLGRIVPVGPDAGELGGIYVFPAFRGLSVARSIVSYLLSRSTLKRLYCIPFTRLATFYMSCGFAPVQRSQDVPESVASKFAWCAGQYPDPVSLLAMSNSAADCE